MIGLLLALSISLSASPQDEVSTESPPTEIEQLEARIERVSESMRESTVGLRFRKGHATGVLVSETGHILTVAHAMPEPGTRVTVVLSDGRELDGVTRGRNEHSDFGLVTISEPSEAWSWSEMAPDHSLRAGQACLGTGYPGLILKSRGAVFRFGVVEVWNSSWIRSTCAIMPGDSGGPLFDLEGRVVGISSWIERSLNANYAVPVELYRASWERLLADEVWDLDSSQVSSRRNVPRRKEALDLGLLFDEQAPMRVSRVLPNSPASRAGVLENDELINLGSKAMRNSRQLENALTRASDQELLTLSLKRGATLVSLALQRTDQGTFPARGEASLTLTAEAITRSVRPTTVLFKSSSGADLRHVTGVVVASNGFLLTKASELGPNPVAELFDGRKLSASRVASDDATDLALLKIDATDLSSVHWKTDHEFLRGQWIISAPYGENASANGVVSALPARVRGSRRAYLGIRMENASGGGALIQTVEPGTAASRAGLRNRDVIQRFNDSHIRTYFDLQSLLRRARPGQDVALQVLRDDVEVELSATLGRRPPFRSRRSSRHTADSISVSDRRSDFPMGVRHDANVAPSECGSLLLDSKGQAIGLNIARLDRTGTLALPANVVEATLEKLLPRPAVTQDQSE